MTKIFLFLITFVTVKYKLKKQFDNNTLDILVQICISLSLTFPKGKIWNIKINEYTAYIWHFLSLLRLSQEEGSWDYRLCSIARIWSVVLQDSYKLALNRKVREAGIFLCKSRSLTSCKRLTTMSQHIVVAKDHLLTKKSPEIIMLIEIPTIYVIEFAHTNCSPEFFHSKCYQLLTKDAQIM